MIGKTGIRQGTGTGIGFHEEETIPFNVIKNMTREEGYHLTPGKSHLYIKSDDGRVDVAERLPGDEEYTVVPIKINDSIRQITAKGEFYQVCARNGIKLCTREIIPTIDSMRRAVSVLEEIK